MLGKDLREALHQGENIYGTHITYMSNLAAAGLLLNAGLDFAFLCGEHMPLDNQELCNMCRFFSANGVAPITRITYPNAAEATKALDLGAHGIVAPYVETVEQVKELVGAVHYRPIKGAKLEKYLSGDLQITPREADFFAEFNQHNVLIIGIESLAAFENLDNLINVRGVDGVFVGPHDMCASLGCMNEYDNERYQEMLEIIIKKCRAAKIGVGVHWALGTVSQTRVKELIGLGMNWVLSAADVTHAMQSLLAWRKALGFREISAIENSGSCAAPKTCAG